MAKKIISIIDARAKRTGQNHPLNKLIKRAQILKKGLKKSNKVIMGVNDYGSLVRFFEAVISETLFSFEMISEDIFLCGIYIARLLADIGNKSPKSWYAIDFVLEGNKTGNPMVIKNGADVCFLLCSIFQERAEHRSMTISDYQKYGIGLYYQYYSSTDRTIGKHMSDNFNAMTEVTQKSIAQLLE